MNVSAWSIHRPLPAILLFILLTAAGLVAFNKLAVSQFPDLTVPVVNVTVTLPGASPSVFTLPSVITAAIDSPPPRSSRTSALTAPGVTCETVPCSWLRADSRTSCVSTARITDEALISAKASTPTRSPSESLLPRVTTATSLPPPVSVSSTSSLTAPV